MVGTDENAQPGITVTSRSGWRPLDRAVMVRCFINDIWIDAPAIAVNDDSHEIRIQWPPVTDAATELGAHHVVIDASRYQPVAGLFD